MNMAKLSEPFPPEAIKQREGFSGSVFDYVETHNVILRLNEAFEGKWSFRVVDTKKFDREITVLGEFEAEGFTKQQYGSSEITFRKNTSEPVSLGDDMKAAASDSLKKCATLFGVGLHLYESKSEKKTAGKTRSRGNGKAKASRNGNSRPPAGNGNGSRQANGISEAQISEIRRVAGTLEMDDNSLDDWIRQAFKRPVEELTYEEGTQVIAALNKRGQEV